MTMCLNCAGLISVSGVALGYTGKFCHCPNPRPEGVRDYPHVAGFAEIKPSTLEELVKGPAPVVETLTPAEFVFWLRGYVAAQGENAPKHLADQLRKVKT